MPQRVGSEPLGDASGFRRLGERLEVAAVLDIWHPGTPEEVAVPRWLGRLELDPLGRLEVAPP